MEDWEGTAGPGRVEEFVSLPSRGKWPRLCLTVASNARDDAIRVVKRGTLGVAQSVTKFAAFVDAAGRLGGNVRRDAAGKAELLEQLLHSLHISADVRVHLAVSFLQVGVSNQRGAAVS